MVPHKHLFSLTAYFILAVPIASELCGCSCEADFPSDEFDEAWNEFECRHLKLMSKEPDAESKCAEYCDPPSRYHAECGEWYGFEKYHLLTCPPEYIWYSSCTCMSSDRTCEMSESSYGDKKLSEGECSRDCSWSSKFADFCALKHGDNFTSRETLGIVLSEGNSTDAGFEIEMCDDIASSWRSGGACDVTLSFALEDLDSKCGCLCSTNTCLDRLKPISNGTTPEACSLYCKNKSPCGATADEENPVQSELTDDCNAVKKDKAKNDEVKKDQSSSSRIAPVSLPVALSELLLLSLFSF